MTKLAHSPRVSTNEKFGDAVSLQGRETARKLARAGQIISAIKWLESMNPGISRQQAKTIVNSFGYSSEPRWPQEDIQPVRCL